jgi:hypothetical protein
MKNATSIFLKSAGRWAEVRQAKGRDVANAQSVVAATKSADSYTPAIIESCTRVYPVGWTPESALESKDITSDVAPSIMPAAWYLDELSASDYTDIMSIALGNED